MTTFKLNKEYQEILRLLKEGKRPLLKLTEDELLYLSTYWDELNKTHAPEKDFLPLLCLSGHLRFSHPQLLPPLLESLSTRKEPTLLVYLLSASLKIILQDCEQRGERIPPLFLKALEKTLEHPHWEVVHWSLRLIDQMGEQSLYFKNQVLQKKISLFHRLGPQARAVLELKKNLERKWRPRERKK